MSKYSLRYKLVLPFVLLILIVPAGTGWMLYDSGTQAVGALARRVLFDVVQQINTSTEQHLAAALHSLNTFVSETAAPAELPPASDIAALRRRAWTISQQTRTPGSYIYFGGADGGFVGVYRLNDYLFELYERQPKAAKRSIYALNLSNQRSALLRTDDYDARTRPWYTSAAQAKNAVWSPVYNDFTSGLPTITVAQPVRYRNATLLGVAASDVELRPMSERLSSLAISQNGVAFVMNPEGFIIAASESDPKVAQRASGKALRHASEMESPLIRTAHKAILEWHRDTTRSRQPLSVELQTENGILNIVAAPLGHKLGVDWITAVIAPRSDFIAGMTRSFNRSLIIAVVCVFVSLLFGMLLLNRVLRDLFALNSAAQKIGQGEVLPPLHIDRGDEIGQLARTFHEMEQNLRTDKLTGVYNREFLSSKIRLMQAQSAGSETVRQRFALLFIDLDNFKMINDHFGHSVGDAVLMTIASRLKDATRASDIVVRYGGDEFVVLLNDMTAAEAVALIEEKIRDAVEMPVELNQAQIQPGVSIGWAMFPEDGTDEETLLKTADSRMFDQKKTRRSTRLPH